MRLIDADDLKKLFPDKGEGSWTYNITAKSYIDNAPTIEITEEQAIDTLHKTGWMQRHDKIMTARPTGEWIEDGYRSLFPVCSYCGSYTSVNYRKVKYCPNCGAKMKGGVGNETDD